MVQETRVPLLNRKRLERHTGFLNHLSMTFEDFTPFLKGFYLTLNSWRPKRDAHDWKMSDKQWVQLLVDQRERCLMTDEEIDLETNSNNDSGCPGMVTASPRLAGDVEALMKMLACESPPVVSLRSKLLVTVVYGFGDASGTGLGATFTCGAGFNFRVGFWGSDDSSELSNWREFTNVVVSLEEEAESGNLEGAEVFMYTDNSTVESYSIKGSSPSPKLLELIIWLRVLTTKFGIKIHIFHVAGTRMIAQGTDGVSRGLLGESMTSYIPIHLSGVNRWPDLEPWIRSWTDDSGILLEPIDWYSVGHDTDE